jgi:hypothetical protein
MFNHCITPKRMLKFITTNIKHLNFKQHWKKKHKCTNKLLIPPESISVLQFEKQNKTKNRLKRDEETIESNRLCAQRIIWNEPETENWERQREKRHYAGDRLREEGARWTERHERCRGRDMRCGSERVFPNPINLGYFSNILQFFPSLKLFWSKLKKKNRFFCPNAEARWRSYRVRLGFNFGDEKHVFCLTRFRESLFLWNEFNFMKCLIKILIH